MYVQPRPRPEPPAELGEALLRSGAATPARGAIEARSDLAAVDELAAALVAEGLDETVAVSAVYAVLTAPTVAVQRTAPAGVSAGARDIVQSVVLERDDVSTELQLTVYLRAVPGNPPVLKVIDHEVGFVDVTDDADRLELVTCVESWWADCSVPLRVPEPLPLQDWAWFGDPTHGGIREVPADWRERLKILGGVYGVQPFIAETPGKVTAQHLADRVDFVFVAVGTKWASSFPPDSASNNISVETVGADAQTFDDVLAVIRSDLLTKASAAAAQPARSRDLDRGEIVYHRKVGGSKKFDHFDAGSDKPCIHGAGAFIGWSGPKATKGMARRYSNFKPDMLIHCDRKMNCGMYGVDAARGGLKPSRNEQSEREPSTRPAPDVDGGSG